MMNETNSSETKRRILAVASEAFSEHGFLGASIREIVARAGANVAAVNYHFGSKEALYKEVVEDEFSKVSSQFNSLIENFDSGAEAGARLHAFAKERLLDAFRTKRVDPPRLLGWEIVSPKFGLKSLFHDTMDSMEKPLIGLLSPLFRPGITEAEKSFAARWFFIAILPAPPVAAGLQDRLGPNPDQEDLDCVINQLADAAVAGVQSLLAVK